MLKFMINISIASNTMVSPPQIRFLGGGVAAHVYAIAAQAVWPAEPLDIRMIDPVVDAPERTLCVWGEPLPLLSRAIVAEWHTLRFGFEDQTWECDLGDWTYRQYTARSIRELVDRTMHVHRDVAVAGDPTDLQVLSLDSRRQQPQRREASVSMVQHFQGRRIRTPEPMFAPDVAVMMDFRTDQTDGVCFIYVLPYSTTEALVECTVFGPAVWSDDLYAKRLDTYIATVLNCSQYETVATEVGSIPMRDAVPERMRGQNWISIGGAAGLTKATTGYTVARCMRDASTLFASLRATGLATAPPRPSRRFDWYDRLLLRIIRDEPEVVPRILWTLFRRNPVRRILMFLDERTSLKQEIAMFWTLPWSPFLRAIIRR